MLVKSAMVALLGLAAVSEATMERAEFRMARRELVQRQNFRGGRGGKGSNSGASAGKGSATGTNTGAGSNTGGSGASVTCLAADSLQTGSESTGQVNNVAADGQSNSATYVSPYPQASRPPPETDRATGMTATSSTSARASC